MNDKHTLPVWEMPTSYRLKACKDKEGNIILSGVLFKTNTPGRSGLIYQLKELNEEVLRLEKYLKENDVFGIMRTNDLVADNKVKLSSVTHILKRIWMGHCGVVHADLRLLNTSMGKGLVQSFSNVTEEWMETDFVSAPFYIGTIDPNNKQVSDLRIQRVDIAPLSLYRRSHEE